MENKTGGLPDEQIVMRSDKGLLTLTNVRVVFDQRTSGASKYMSIMLEQVASCGLVTRSHPLFLFLAAAAAFGLYNAEAETVWIVVIPVFLVAVYFASRSAVLKISSNGGESIVVPAKGMGRDAIVEFLNEVDAAKLRLRLATTKAGTA